MCCTVYLYRYLEIKQNATTLTFILLYKNVY